MTCTPCPDRPEPIHPALVDKALWDKAQRMGRRHGNVRDPEMPTQRAGRGAPGVVPPGQHSAAVR